MGVVVEEGACGWPKRAAQGVFRRWEAQSGVSGSSGAAGAGPWAARSHSTTRTLLPPKTPLLDLNLAQISCSSDPATLNYPRVGAQPKSGGWVCSLNTLFRFRYMKYRDLLQAPVLLGDQCPSNGLHTAPCGSEKGPSEVELNPGHGDGGAQCRLPALACHGH